MGLGKTLQASAIVASDIAEYRLENSSEEQPPSLIICPSTLVGHWAYEIEKYIDPSLISTLQYVGSAQERISLRSYFDKYNVIITYMVSETVENPSSLDTEWNTYPSSFPNNILDLWSLFDFLMPGFLGTERQVSGLSSSLILMGISAMIFNMDETTNKAVVYAGVPDKGNTSQVDSSANAFIWE
ncbi:btaf1 RNA polymerase II, B-TFIID transcription factor-associated, 170kDa [Ancistrocladus abbreviatus]